MTEFILRLRALWDVIEVLGPDADPGDMDWVPSPRGRPPRVCAMRPVRFRSSTLARIADAEKPFLSMLRIFRKVNRLAVEAIRLQTAELAWLRGVTEQS